MDTLILRLRGRPLRFVALFLSLGVLFLLTTPAIPPAAAAQTIPAAVVRNSDAASQTVPAATLRNPDGTMNLANGINATLDLHGWQVTLDSKRGPVLSPASSAVPQSASLWHVLPHQGLNGANGVTSLAVIGSDVYVGGYFTATYDGAVTNLNHIARYSGGAWHALPHGGLNDTVTALGVDGTQLYVGGNFTGTADGSRTDLNNIAWFSQNKWIAMPHGGLNGNILAFVENFPVLYVGGTFTQSMDGQVTGLNHIARYVLDHHNHFHLQALSNQGLNGYYVAALALYGGAVYAGGSFTASGDNQVQNLNYIARYSQGSWQALANNGLSYQVYALTVYQHSLYVGGSFAQTADGAVTNLNNIARYHADTWSALPHQGLNQAVRSLAVYGTELYVGGDFYQTADGALTNFFGVVKLSGGKWVAPPTPGPGASVSALAVEGTNLFAGGNFGSPGNPYNFIARLSSP